MCPGNLWRYARGHLADSTEGEWVCELERRGGGGGAHRTWSLTVDGCRLMLTFGWAALLVQEFAAVVKVVCARFRVCAGQLESAQ